MDEHAVVATRRSLHAVAERLLAGPQDRQHGEIRLQVTPGGFGRFAGPVRQPQRGQHALVGTRMTKLPGRSRAPAGDGYRGPRW